MNEPKLRGLFSQTRRRILSGAVKLAGAQLLPAEMWKAASILLNPAQAAQKIAGDITSKIATLGSQHFLKSFVSSIAFDVSEVVGDLSAPLSVADFDDEREEIETFAAMTMSDFSTTATALMRFAYLSPEERALLLREPKILQHAGEMAEYMKSIGNAPNLTLEDLLDPRKFSAHIGTALERLQTKFEREGVSPDFFNEELLWQGCELNTPPDWYTALSRVEQIKVRLERDFIDNFGVPFGGLIKNRDFIKDMAAAKGEEEWLVTDLPKLEEVFGPISSRKAFLEARGLELKIQGVPAAQARAQATRELEKAVKPPFFIVEKLPEDNGLLARLARGSVLGGTHDTYRISLAPDVIAATKSPEQQQFPEFEITHLMDFAVHHLHNAQNDAHEKKLQEGERAPFPQPFDLRHESETAFTIRVAKDSAFADALEDLRSASYTQDKSALVKSGVLFERYYPARPHLHPREAITDAANWQGFERAALARSLPRAAPAL